MVMPGSGRALPCPAKTPKRGILKMNASIKCAIWARVSTAEQTASSQLAELRRWAAGRGLDVVVELVTEDSAWQNGNGKGTEFDRQRTELVNGARLGHYSVVLVWAL